MARSPKATIRVGDVCSVLDRIAPLRLAAEWDNVGLLMGREDDRVRRLLLTIDLTEEVLAEAARGRCEMVMSYHPMIFKPIARVGGVVLAAARAGLAVYSPHTALDAAPGGTNDVLAGAIGIADARPLEAIAGQADCKVVVFAPVADATRVTAAAFDAGAGRIGQYTECAFRTPGVGTFRGGEGTRPAVGRAGRREEVEELRVEMICPRDRLGDVLSAVRGAHSYETPAIDVYPLAAAPGETGTGRVGRLARPVSLETLLRRVKRFAGVGKVLLAGARDRTVSVAACAAGSAGGMFRSAVAAGAEVYVTGEMRHHDALAAAAAGLTVICLGHSNSERPAVKVLAQRLRRELPSLTVALAAKDRDPFHIR